MKSDIMSYERIPSHRERVFQIYGIDPEDERYNCHHIVPRSEIRKDIKNGNINIYSTINCKSNLYPIRKELHVILHQIINAADNGEDTKPLLLHWHEVEEALSSEEKLKEIQKKEIIKRSDRIDLYKELSYQKNGLMIAQRLSNETLTKIFDNFPDLQPCYGTI
jgi:hypothetical protein